MWWIDSQAVVVIRAAYALLLCWVLCSGGAYEGDDDAEDEAGTPAVQVGTVKASELVSAGLKAFPSCTDMRTTMQFLVMCSQRSLEVQPC